MKKLSIEEQLKAIKKIVHDREVIKINARGRKISLSALLDYRLPIGKYKGETLGIVARRDPEYLLWLSTQEMGSERLEERIEAIVIAIANGKVC